MKARVLPLLAGLLECALAACGGSSSSSSSASSDAMSSAPTITTQPTNASVAAGQTAMFSVVAGGTAPLSYQWQKNGAAISGATTSSYTTPPTASTDNGAAFVVLVANSVGSVSSSPATLTVTSAPLTGNDVVTFKNDVARSGQYLNETTLTPTNVASTTFGLLHNFQVDGKVDAQPLYLAQLTIGSAAHNVVFVATEHGSVYAFDADTFTQLWKISLLRSGETPSDTHGCGQVTPEIGITSTPVIDRSAGPNGALYVVAMSLDQSSNYHQRLHALDVTSGAELFNGPAEISASSPNLGGTVSFAPGQYEERAALLQVNSSIYLAFTSHCDISPYQGWIMTYDRLTLAHTGTLNLGPNAAGAGYANQGPGIWMAGDGPGADAAGNVYLLTGNGPFETTQDANGFPSSGDYGNSFVKIANAAGTLTVADYFAMKNEVAESAADEDLGSGGEMLLPDLADGSNRVRHLVVGAGKDGNIYVVDRDNMGKFNATSNNIYQELDAAVSGGVFSSPAFFNNTVFYGPVGGTLRAFAVASALLSTAATSQSATIFGYPGTSPVISANGAANGIVWAHENANPAVLHAYDASNLAHELYNSNQATGARDQFGNGNKFITPIVTGGKVFVGTVNSLAVFGLLH